MPSVLVQLIVYAVDAGGLSACILYRLRVHSIGYPDILSLAILTLESIGEWNTEARSQLIRAFPPFLPSSAYQQNADAGSPPRRPFVTRISPLVFFSGLDGTPSELDLYAIMEAVPFECTIATRCSLVDFSLSPWHLVYRYKLLKRLHPRSISINYVQVYPVRMRTVTSKLEMKFFHFHRSPESLLES